MSKPEPRRNRALGSGIWEKRIVKPSMVSPVPSTIVIGSVSETTGEKVFSPEDVSESSAKSPAGVPKNTVSVRTSLIREALMSSMVAPLRLKMVYVAEALPGPDRGTLLSRVNPGKELFSEGNQVGVNAAC